MDKTRDMKITGDYIRHMYPEEDPKMTKFYEKYPFMRNVTLDFDTYEQPAPVEETEDLPSKDYTEHFFGAEWARINRQRDTDNKSQPGYFKIGTVSLVVPPSQIAISDVKNNFTYSTMRARGDITLQSGHTVKAIELDMIFHDLDTINNKLRPLLAQLKCTPFIPIENEYVRSAIIPQDFKLQAFAAEREERAEEALKSRDMWRAKIEGFESKMKKIINDTTFYVINVGDSQDLIEEKQQKESETKRRLALLVDEVLDENDRGIFEVNASVAYNVKKAFVDAKNSKEATDTFVESTISQIADLEDRKNSYNDKISDILRALPPVKYESAIVPAVLSELSISTVPGAPESLACHLTLFVFNCLPYTPGFRFRKTTSSVAIVCPECGAENPVDSIVCQVCKTNIEDRKEERVQRIAPTSQIDECDSFVKWYSKNFLSDSEESVKRVKQNFSNNVTLETLRRSRTVADGKTIDIDAIITLNTDHFINAECVSIAVSFSNRIKFLPIIGYGVPTCQFLGSNSSSVSMTFTSFPEEEGKEDIFLESMRFFLNQVDATARETTKQNRRAWVRADNDVIKMTGIKNLIPQSFDVNTVPGSPGMSSSIVRFIDINTTFEEREKIRLVDPDSDERIDAFIENEMEKWFRTSGREAFDAQGRIGNASVVDDCLDEIRSTGYRDAFLPRHSTLGLLSSDSGHLIDKRSDLIFAGPGSDQFVYNYYSEAARSLGLSMKKAKYTDPDRDKYYRDRGSTAGYFDYQVKLPESWSAAFGKGQTRLDSSVFDSISVKGPVSIGERASSSFQFKPLDLDTRKYIYDSFNQKFNESLESKTPVSKELSRLLFRSTVAGEKKIEEWVKLIEKQDSGQGELPDNVEEILEREENSTRRDPAYKTYEDLSLPLYDEIGIGYAPTFSDIGISPAYGASTNSLARHKYDIAEPDFYFEHVRLKGNSGIEFNFDAGSWGTGNTSYNKMVEEQSKAHKKQLSIIRKQVDEDIKKRGSAEKQEKTDQMNQEKTGTVDQETSVSESPKDASIVSRIPVENMDPNDVIVGTVSHVVDGDTIMIEDYDEKIRIIGINTSELKYTKDSNGKDTTTIDEEKSEPGSLEAKRRLEELLFDKDGQGRKVKLRIDQYNIQSKHRGKYGRPLMYVYLVEANDQERDVGKTLIDEGLAMVKSDFAFTEMVDYMGSENFKFKKIERKDSIGNTLLPDGDWWYNSLGLYGERPKESKDDKNHQ